MGAIAETFRQFEGVLRSCHPALSFSAWGKNAEYITAGRGSWKQYFLTSG